MSLACPWAHRTLIGRKLKGLSDVILVLYVHWHMDEQGWRFITDEELAQLGTDLWQFGTEDHVNGFKRIREVYFKANPDYDARFTVPVLWDKKTSTIVNNELSEILRMLNSEFNLLADPQHAAVDLYPELQRQEIDDLNAWVYDNINNGVYKTGFATKQEVYDREVVNVFKHLDRVEQLVAKNKPFLLGDALTEADVRLYTTIVRFDPVYHQHFKCNIGMIRHDYPNIDRWLRHLYWEVPGFKETTDFDHIKYHYTRSHPNINPNGITPLGPVPNILPKQK